MHHASSPKPAGHWKARTRAFTMLRWTPSGEVSFPTSMGLMIGCGPESLSGPRDLPDPCVLRGVASPPPQSLHRVTDWPAARLCGRLSYAGSIIHSQRLLTKLEVWQRSVTSTSHQLTGLAAANRSMSIATSVGSGSVDCGMCSLKRPFGRLAMFRGPPH